jgi:UDP-glucose 4-epimerase
VFFSSAAVYGNPHRLPIDEDATVAPISPYGIHKAGSEFLLQHYTRLHNLRTSILRIFSAFGPGLRKQLFWDLSKRAFEAVARGQKSLTVYGTGQESRDFMYATDIANAALWIANRPALPGCCEVFNVASGRQATIAEAASLLVELLDIDISLQFSGLARPGEPLNWRADVAKLAGTGYRPEVSLSEGASRVARWMKEELSVEAYRVHSASAV